MDLAAEELELEAGGRLEGGRPEGARGQEAGMAQDRWWRAQARGQEASNARSTAGDLWELDREAGRTSSSLSLMRTGGRR
jgi:hypothetical protein